MAERRWIKNDNTAKAIDSLCLLGVNFTGMVINYKSDSARLITKVRYE